MKPIAPPPELWSGVDPAVPLALLPLRLEVRFGTRHDGAGADAVEVAVLRVRIYPDEIASTGPEGEGPAGRAGPVPVHLLPDGWLITGTTRSGRAFEHHLVRGTAPLAVQPPGGDGSPVYDPGGARTVSPDPAVAWVVDFAAACQVGMAAEIDLQTPDQARAGERTEAMEGLARLTVVGVHDADSRRPAAEVSDELAALLATRAERGEAALAAQGTATNLLGDDPAPVPGEAPEGDEDGRRLENALGVPAGTLAMLPGYGGSEGRDAADMARMLFPVTFGEAITTLGMNPISWSDADPLRERRRLARLCAFAREHVGDHVRGRGPLPALRVGRQPYGVLPILPARRWQRHGDEPEPMAALVDLLARLRQNFAHAAAGVPFCARGSGGADSAAALSTILGQAPVPHPGRYGVRTVTGPELMSMVAPPLHIGGSEAVPLPGGAVWTAAATGISALDVALRQTVLAQLDVGPERPLYRPVAATGDDGRTPADRLRDLAAGTAGPASGDLLDRLARCALEAAGEAEAAEFAVRLAPGHLAVDIAAVSAEFRTAAGGVTPAWAAVTTTPVRDVVAGGTVLGALGADVSFVQAVRDPQARAELVAAVAGRGEASPRGYGEVRDAMAALAERGRGYTDEDWARLVGETLDCTGSRLDAWFTSLASRRLGAVRTARPHGLAVGAWGVLTDVQPAARITIPPPRGWAEHVRDVPGAPQEVLSPDPAIEPVHAPSPAQAVAAGLLRAGELAHRGQDGSALSIDLDSVRVRTALRLVDGMLRGQTLSALLGRQAERALHEAGAQVLIGPLRGRFPQHRARDAGTASARDAVPANVLDGLALWEARESVPELCADLPGATRDACAAMPWILADLGAAVDALADLLVADGVHRLAIGDIDGAANGFAAIARGLAPPVPQVATEPRSGVTVTHRVVLFLDPLGGSEGWNAQAPRARVAPAAERWAQEVLGPAAAVAIGDSDAQRLGLCALDLLAACGDEPAAGAPAVVTTAGAFPVPAETAALAATAHAVLAGARPAVDTDLVADGETGRSAAEEAGPGRVSPVLDAIGAGLELLDAAAARAETAAGEAGAESAAVPRASLAAFAAFAVPGAAGTLAGAGPVAASTAAALAFAARDLAARVRGLLAGEVSLRSAIEAARLLCGAATVPVIDARCELAGAGAGGVTEPEAAAWLSRISRVRGALARYDDLCLFRAARGDDPGPAVAHHLPPTPGLAWLGGPLTPVDDPRNEHRRWVRPTRPHVHLVAVGAASRAAESTVQAMVVDEAAEVLPAPSVNTGAAIRYDAPGARPPQVLLLALHPDPGGRWSADLLRETVDEAMELALLRGVELDDLDAAGLTGQLPLVHLPDDGSAQVRWDPGEFARVESVLAREHIVRARRLLVEE